MSTQLRSSHPRPGDIVIYEDDGVGLLSSYQRSSHLTPLARDTAVQCAEFVAAIDHVDAWLTEDGSSFERLAAYRPAIRES